MARRRDLALAAGFTMSVAGGAFVSLHPGYAVQGMAVLVPGLLLFLWGLLTTAEHEE